MLRSRRGGGRNADTAELNITVFMNLMVILVPFLLITAVFSRLAVLDLYLPGAASAASDPAEQIFQLEIIVRKSQIEVGDRNAGLFAVYPKRATGYDFDALGRKLSEIKGRYPSKTDASILLEPDILYQTVVEVMDTVRVAETLENGATKRYELFPDISIGDAPMLDGGA